MTEEQVRTFDFPTKPGKSRRRSREDIEAATSRASTAPAAVFDPSPVVPQPVSRVLRVAFGKNLKAARLKSGLHQSDLANRAGLTTRRLSLIEDGDLMITLRTMTELARLAGLKASAMLTPATCGVERK